MRTHIIALRVRAKSEAVTGSKTGQLCADNTTIVHIVQMSKTCLLCRIVVLHCCSMTNVYFGKPEPFRH